MKLGDLVEYAGTRADALNAYRRAQAILETLGATDPNVRSSLVKVFEKIGTVQLLQSDTCAALNSAKRYLQVAQELLVTNPNDPSTRRRGKSKIL